MVVSQVSICFFSNKEQQRDGRKGGKSMQCFDCFRLHSHSAQTFFSLFFVVTIYANMLLLSNVNTAAEKEKRGGDLKKKVIMELF